MIVGLAGNVVNGLLGWSLIYGHLGLPALGVRAAATPRPRPSGSRPDDDRPAGARRAPPDLRPRARRAAPAARPAGGVRPRRAHRHPVRQRDARVRDVHRAARLDGRRADRRAPDRPGHHPHLVPARSGGRRGRERAGGQRARASLAARRRPRDALGAGHRGDLHGRLRLVFASRGEPSRAPSRAIRRGPRHANAPLDRRGASRSSTR